MQEISFPSICIRSLTPQQNCGGSARYAFHSSGTAGSPTTYFFRLRLRRPLFRRLRRPLSVLRNPFGLQSGPH